MSGKKGEETEERLKSITARTKLCWPSSLWTDNASHMWIINVVSSRPCFEGFSPGTPLFSFLHKIKHCQIPIRFGNSGSKSLLVESVEIPIYFKAFSF